MSQQDKLQVRRRDFLGIAAVGTLGTLAGCSGGEPSPSGTTTIEDTTTETSTPSTEEPTTETTTSTASETTIEGTTTRTTSSSGPETIDPGTTLQFDGYTRAWEATSPSSIAGTSNPTLALVEGAEYTFMWSNKDGEPHNVLFENSGGDRQFVRTEIITSGSQEVTFEAKAGMATYYCEVHPSTMRGDVNIV